MKSIEYYDNICIENNKVNNNYDLCVDLMKFGLVNYVNGTFHASGIVGLAPGNEGSIIYQLFDLKSIKKARVGLDYSENGVISIGNWEYSKATSKKIFQHRNYGAIDYNFTQYK